MFSFPPLPPKDYALRHVNQNQKSSQEFTPGSLPRITQTNLGLFCAPIPYKENEQLTNVHANVSVNSVNSQLLEKWTDQAKAFWVDKPGKNDYFLHDLYRKYSSQAVSNYHARYKCNERVFYRSFMYELDCAKAQRREKLDNKVAREEKIKFEKQKAINETKLLEEQQRKVDTMGVKACRTEKPFWWKDTNRSDNNVKEKNIDDRSIEMATDLKKDLRWHEEPTLVNCSKKTFCQRRFEMAQIGIPFKNEACNWYYKNYPLPRHLKV